MNYSAAEIVANLEKIGTKLVCIDFDATFLSIHTSGSWSASASTLHSYVRPLFLELVPLLIDGDMDVAVVTFSPQVELIRKVLLLCFPVALANRIVVRGDDDSWETCERDYQVFFNTDGFCKVDSRKIPYIVSAAKAVSGEAKRIRNDDTVLIDDDHHNIRMANDNGIAGIWFEPQETDIRSLCHSIQRLHVQNKENLSQLDTSPTKDQIGNPSDATTPYSNTGTKRKNAFTLCTPSPIMKNTAFNRYIFHPEKPVKMRCSRTILIESPSSNTTNSTLRTNIHILSPPPALYIPESTP